MKLTKHMLHKLVKETLNEVEWLPGKNDEDTLKGGIFIFDPDEKYNIEGATNGLIYHALKHAGSVKPPLSAERDQYVQGMKELLMKYAQKKPVYYRRKGRGGQEQISPEKIAQVTSFRPFRNTLDLIQDKISLKQDLSEIEAALIKQAQPLINKYKAMTDNAIENSIAHASDPKRGKEAFMDKNNNLVVTWNKKASTFHLKKGDPEQIVQQAVKPRKVAEQMKLTKQILVTLIEEAIDYGSEDWGKAYRDGIRTAKNDRKNPEMIELFQTERNSYKMKDRKQRKDILQTIREAMKEINWASIKAATADKSPTYYSGFLMGYKDIFGALEGALVPKHQQWGYNSRLKGQPLGPAFGGAPLDDDEDYE